MRATAELGSAAFDDVLSELVARVPVHTPEWTEGSDADPGVTVLELFAFLAESLVGRGADPRLRTVLRPAPRASMRLIVVEPDRAVLHICRRARVLRRCDELELVRRDHGADS